MAVSLILTLTESEVNRANNTSKVTAVLKAKSTYGSWAGDAQSGWISIDGKKYTFTHSFSANTITTLITKSRIVEHNSDGSKTCEVKASYSPPQGTVTTSKKIALTKISRKFTVSYNPNGGSGAPSSQTKIYGTTLVLSSKQPTRNGYTFNGWATSKSGGVAYRAGGNYTNNAAVTLYAVWTAKSYTITGNANGGTGSNNATVTFNSTFSFSSLGTPVRSGYAFRGWAESASSTEAKYTSNSTLKWTSASAKTFYAVWINTYLPPTISNVVSQRVALQDGDYVEYSEGTILLLSFDWSAAADGNGVSTSTSLSIISNEQTITDSLTSSGGTYAVVLDENDFNVGEEYSIVINLTDTSSKEGVNKTATSLTYLTKGGYPVHISSKGNAISLFGIADDDNPGFSVGDNTNIEGHLETTEYAVFGGDLSAALVDISDRIGITSSNGTISGVKAYKFGQSIQLFFGITTTSSWATGGNIDCTLTGEFLPITNSNGVGYYGNHVVVARLYEGGTLRLRHVGQSSISAGETIYVNIVYIVNTNGVVSGGSASQGGGGSGIDIATVQELIESYGYITDAGVTSFNGEDGDIVFPSLTNAEIENLLT